MAYPRDGAGGARLSARGGLRPSALFWPPRACGPPLTTAVYPPGHQRAAGRPAARSPPGLRRPFLAAYGEASARASRGCPFPRVLPALGFFELISIPVPASIHHGRCRHPGPIPARPAVRHRDTVRLSATPLRALRHPRAARQISPRCSLTRPTARGPFRAPGTVLHGNRRTARASPLMPRSVSR